jgi:polar amino acid transport system substrate-binding protein
MLSKQGTKDNQPWRDGKHFLAGNRADSSRIPATRSAVHGSLVPCQTSCCRTIRKWTVWLYAAAILVFAFLTPMRTGAQVPPLHSWSQKQPLIIAAEDDAAPWSRADGTGYANDVVKAAFMAVGMEIQLRVMPYARCKRMAENGEVVGCLSMSPAPEFNGLIELSARPLFTCSAGYFYNVAKPPGVKRQEDLPARTVVGTVIGYEYPSGFEKLVQSGALVREESTSEEINLRKLALGRVDLALLTYNQVKSPAWLIRRAQASDKVRTTFIAGQLRSYIGFSKKHPTGATARRQFDKGYRLITVNGTLKRITNLWLGKLKRESADEDRPRHGRNL